MRIALALALASLSLFGCAKKIGDECTTDAECGTSRICDRASRGGYCTVSPCDRQSCPADSVCVEFDDDSTWCMGTCENNDDCRGGYDCDQASAAVPFCRQRQ